jgi:cytoskeletal protein CcmA (bactofilin family)
LTVSGGDGILSAMPRTKDPAPLLYSTELSSCLVMNGDLRTKGSLLLKGNFLGTIASDSHVGIDSGALVGPCALIARSASVKGSFSGSIQAASSIEIGRSARVKADLETPTLAIAEGSSFEGEIRMPGGGD